jgi:hypothetical protein
MIILLLCSPQVLANPAISSQKSQLTWALPAGWKELAADQMRVGNFEIKGAEGEEARVTIIPLAGIAGGDLGNVNRWRGQIGLGPITAEDLKKQEEKVEIAGMPAPLYDLAGNSPEIKERMHILASMVLKDGTSWFFKMMGHDKLVQQQKGAFVQFLKSVQFKPATSVSPAPTESSSLLSNPTNTPMMASSTAGPETSAFAAKAPAHWQAQTAGSMLLAKYSISQGADAKADVTVSSFPGTVGGIFANVNRWRSQIGLPPVQESELGSITNAVSVGKSTAILVDFKNEAQKLGLIVMTVSKSGNSWFYKLSGNAELVGKEKTNFVQWVTAVESEGK